MLDFNPIKEKKITYKKFVAGLTVVDLGDLTNEMIDEQLRIISDCEDVDVVFLPQDPDAHDPYAASEDEVQLPWTLGHIIVHTTASSEESAFLAAELARGVQNREGRSRYEVDWNTIKTVKQVRNRLEESRRMRLASLKIWPDPPHLENFYISPYSGLTNPLVRFVLGLSHDDSHLEHLKDVVNQALASRK